MKTTVILNENAPTNDAITTSISNCNPSATDAQLYNAVVALSGLTTNTFVSAVRRNESELTAPDTLSGGVD